MRYRWIWLFGAMALLSIGVGRAQDDRGSDERLDRVERELNQLQRQVYRNEVGGAPAPMTPAGADSSGGGIDTQLRLDQIESQMRTLTGQVEELQNGLSQLTSKLDKVQADNEARFQQLEGTTPSPSGTTALNGPPPPGGAGNPSERPSSGGYLVAPGEPPPDLPPPPPPNGALPSGNAADQFNAAFGLLRKQDFPEAAEAFKAFLKEHPSHPLAGNAQYWLGEISYVRADYKAAAALFAEGYSKYPQSPKAPDSLLKLGLSLGGMGQKKEACLSFARLDHDFPSPAPNIKEQESRGRRSFGC